MAFFLISSMVLDLLTVVFYRTARAINTFKTFQVFLPVGEEAFWLLLFSLVSCIIWGITIREQSQIKSEMTDQV